MNKINELITNFKNALKIEIDVNSLQKSNENVKALQTLVNEHYQYQSAKDTIIKGNELVSDFEGNYENLRDQIIGKLINLNNLTNNIIKEQEKISVLRETLKTITNMFFQDYKQSNFWGVDIYNDVIDDIHLKVESHLLGKLEQGIPNFWGYIEGLQKVGEGLQQQLGKIQDFLSEIKQNYAEITNKKTLSPMEEIILEINKLSETLPQNSQEISTEINNLFSEFHQAQLDFLEKLQNEINRWEQESSTQKSTLEGKVAELSKNLEAGLINKNTMEQKMTELSKELETSLAQRKKLEEKVADLSKQVEESKIAIKREEKALISEKKEEEKKVPEKKKPAKKKVKKA